MHLLDTNIFLEILLSQEKSSVCKTFITSHYDEISISDFSLHSIGVILFRYKKHEIFSGFILDMIPKIRILNLPSSEYVKLFCSDTKYELDFDDFYQYIIAKYYDLQIVTMDSDFKKVKDVKVNFL
ncbi:MAG: PIN domain-containing protein [Bacteroidetes bacterium]|nr:PIN domain-containing protein [Bacteroidota bacterium]MBU1679308.1 PIN domain-containing protein [Bacteroidota bacterium]MBU2506476.1 PIN domain-containing protein [Bacteroidota bacterium]